MTETLRTGSLRARVTWSTIALAAVTLVVVLVLVDTLFGVLAKRELTKRIKDRAELTVQLDRQAVKPAQLVRRVSGNGIRARLVTVDGQEFGVEQPENPGDYLTAARTLTDGAKVTLYADSGLVTSTQAVLRQVLALVGLGALGLTALALVLTVRRSLRPLEAMADTARSIAGGQRGRRLAPDRGDTDLGRTAVAFDSMVDELEGAERRARDSEERTRRFLADAAHELRTPIAGVQAAAEAVVQTGAGRSDEDRERLQVLLVREAKRAGRLVEDLLSLARIDAGLELHREPVDLLTLAGAEADRFRLLASSTRIELHGQPVTVLGDSQRLAQVLGNLLDNARRYGPPDGVITIGVRASGGWATIQVADQGPGVPPEDRERIFLRLVRLDSARDRSSGGAGLGLAIARGIALAHGGDLRCVPPTGGLGAVFQLVLPG